MIGNIEKRKELAQMIRDKYVPMADEDVKVLDNEVKAAFDGYEKGMRDIAQLIADGKNMKEIKAFICNQMNGMTNDAPFSVDALCSTDIKEYLNTTVREELINRRCNKDDADHIIKIFIENSELRQDIIEDWELKTVRLQTNGKPVKNSRQ